MREVPIEVRWQGQALPAVAPVDGGSIGPGAASGGATAGGNGGGGRGSGREADSGRIRTSDGVVELQFEGEEGCAERFSPCRETRWRRVSVRLEDGRGAAGGRDQAARFVPLAVPSDRLSTVLHVENQGTEPEPTQRVEMKDKEAPARYALAVPYQFEPGWRYLTLVIAGEATIPEGAEALWMWVKGDGTGNTFERECETRRGRCFRSTWGRSTGTDWRPVRVLRWMTGWTLATGVGPTMACGTCPCGGRACY